MQHQHTASSCRHIPAHPTLRSVPHQPRPMQQTATTLCPIGKHPEKSLSRPDPAAAIRAFLQAPYHQLSWPPLPGQSLLLLQPSPPLLLSPVWVPLHQAQGHRQQHLLLLLLQVRLHSCAAGGWLCHLTAAAAARLHRQLLLLRVTRVLRHLRSAAAPAAPAPAPAAVAGCCRGCCCHCCCCCCHCCCCCCSCCARPCFGGTLGRPCPHAQASWTETHAGAEHLQQRVQHKQHEHTYQLQAPKNISTSLAARRPVRVQACGSPAQPSPAHRPRRHSRHKAVAAKQRPVQKAPTYLPVRPKPRRLPRRQQQQQQLTEQRAAAVECGHGSFCIHELDECDAG